MNDTAPARQGLDLAPWESVLTAARGATDARTPSTVLTATATNFARFRRSARAALRLHEARACPPTRSRKAARTTRAARCYPRVHDKDNKTRPVPLYTHVADALERGRELRDEIPELVDDPSLFPGLAAASATAHPGRRRSAIHHRGDQDRTTDHARGR